MQLNDNGAWSWFMDPRVIVNDGKLIIGSVRAVGSNQANVSDPRWGNVEISVYDLENGTTATSCSIRISSRTTTTRRRFSSGPTAATSPSTASTRKSGGCIYRLSEPHNPLVWGPAMVAETPGDDAPVQGNNATYANLFRMPNGRIYNFIRAFHHDPNYMYLGRRWQHVEVRRPLAVRQGRLQSVS